MTKLNAWSLNLDNGNLPALNTDKFDNMDEIVASLPEGVYTTIRTYNHYFIFHLEDHLSRLKESLEISQINFDINLHLIHPALSDILEKSDLNELRIRLHIPFSDLNTCIILIEELLPLSDLIYRSGVKVKTNQILRSNPRAKLTSFIQKASNEKSLLKTSGLEESIMTNNNRELLEGLTSNFFAIRKNEVLTAGTGILRGITRKLVLEEAELAGIKIDLHPVKIDELYELDEAFITSTSRGVMPVIKIDNVKIGNGKPGNLTKKLTKLFNKRISNELESFSLR
jgi:branched-chain amino acid aminotransferase